MSSSFLNMFLFFSTTAFYYYSLNPLLTYDIRSNFKKYEEYVKDKYMYLGLYILLAVVLQVLANSYIITLKCGGSVKDNIGRAFLFAIVWLLMLGFIIVVVQTGLPVGADYVGAFSNVIGYFCVSSSANKLLTELLIDRDVQKKIDDDTTLSPKQKEAMQSAADLIIKICGNTSILINQMTPSNFNFYWNGIDPLKKEKYQTENDETIKIRDELFSLVVTKHNIGESMWYILTGIAVAAYVEYVIITGGCVTNPKTLQEKSNAYSEEEQQVKEEQEIATSTTYTITN